MAEKVLILGLSKSGIAAAKFAASKGCDVYLTETKNEVNNNIEIAKEEKITRSYVSKVIAKLIEKGYDIKRVNRMGYIYQNDIMSELLVNVIYKI